jgi:hypothetical protein
MLPGIGMISKTNLTAAPPSGAAWRCQRSAGLRLGAVPTATVRQIVDWRSGPVGCIVVVILKCNFRPPVPVRAEVTQRSILDNSRRSCLNEPFENSGCEWFARACSRREDAHCPTNMETALDMRTARRLRPDNARIVRPFSCRHGVSGGFIACTISTGAVLRRLSSLAVAPQ